MKWLSCLKKIGLGWTWTLPTFSVKNRMSSEEIFLDKPIHLDFSRDIIHCHEYLRERWPKLVFLFRKETQRDLVLTCTWRSQKEQERLYQQGRTTGGEIVTYIDGITKLSKHNLYPSLAFDVAVDIDPNDSKVTIKWNNDYYYPLGPICQKLNLVWGGNWSTLKDFCHIEIPSDVT